MRIGVIKVGNMHPDIVARWGDYPAIYADMLHSADPSLAVTDIDLVGGEALGSVRDADGWLVGGSRHGTYDDLPWIGPLKAFMRGAVEAGVPVAGICFGHQALAEAMGGKVVKHPAGWSLGREEFDARTGAGWTAPLGTRWAGHTIYQDQVVKRPDGATLLYGSPFCENAALAYGDPERPAAISVQAHPEFGAGILRDLIELRMRSLLPADTIAAAEQSLGLPVANADWARIIVDFFKNKNAGV